MNLGSELAMASCPVAVIPDLDASEPHRLLCTPLPLLINLPALSSFLDLHVSGNSGPERGAVGSCGELWGVVAVGRARGGGVDLGGVVGSGTEWGRVCKSGTKWGE
eukprot:3104907-Rhodomonas_salina.1